MIGVTSWFRHHKIALILHRLSPALQIDMSVVVFVVLNLSVLLTDKWNKLNGD
jgi:hypothetical protein